MWKLVFKHRKSVKGEKYDWNENNTRLFVYIACLHSIAFRYSNFDIQMHSRKILLAKKNTIKLQLFRFFAVFSTLYPCFKGKWKRKQKIKENKIQITFNRHWVSCLKEQTMPKWNKCSWKRPPRRYLKTTPTILSIVVTVVRKSLLAWRITRIFLQHRPTLKTHI